MIEDNNTEETTLEQALASDDSTTNWTGLYGVSVIKSADANPYPTYINTSAFVGSVSSVASGTYVPHQQQTFASGTAYVNISPADFATIRTMIREELQSIKGEIVKQVKDELVRDVRISTGASRI